MKLTNSRGELTAYALSCGYVMKFNVKIKLYKISNTKSSYEIIVRNKEEIKSYVFFNLTEAKKQAKKFTKIYK